MRIIKLIQFINIQNSKIILYLFVRTSCSFIYWDNNNLRPLPNYFFILFAELTAIRLSLIYSQGFSLEKILVFFSSLSAFKTIQNCHAKKKHLPYLLRNNSFFGKHSKIHSLTMDSSSPSYNS